MRGVKSYYTAQLTISFSLNQILFITAIHSNIQLQILPCLKTQMVSYRADHFITGYSNAACAAANLAIGTRNGEQLT